MPAGVPGTGPAVAVTPLLPAVEEPAERAQVLQIVAGVIRLVDDRGYLPGERILSEREIAERFGVGRAVVREAMAMLESMRYLKRRRGSGVFLTESPQETSLEALVISSEVGLPLSDAVNGDSFEVRRIIEGQAVRLACARRTDADLAALTAVLGDFAAVSDNLTASVYDFRFHMAILRSTGNEILVRLVHPFYILSRSRREAFFTEAERRAASHAQHVALFDAIVARDADTAAELMKNHIGRADKWFSSHASDA
jgi:GntR family transcriptional regulator, transcriptional repressor for pyruvate dehydrogenase complex